MAKAHVRIANAVDAPVIARIQLATWQVAYRDVVPGQVLQEAASNAGGALIEGHWRTAITAPPTPRHRVLVAVEQTTTEAWVVGFTASGPATADDLAGTELSDEQTLLISTIVVEPRFSRRGHGSRLLAAAIDLARDDGFTAAATWVLAADTASLKFYASAGWEADGATRILDMNGELVNELRLVTIL